MDTVDGVDTRCPMWVVVGVDRMLGRGMYPQPYGYT